MCRQNYMMMYTYYRLLCDEYTYRYNKEHGSKDYWWLLQEPPKNMSSSLMGHTPVPQAMLHSHSAW